MYIYNIYYNNIYLTKLFYFIFRINFIYLKSITYVLVLQWCCSDYRKSVYFSVVT